MKWVYSACKFNWNKRRTQFPYQTMYIYTICVPDTQCFAINRALALNITLVTLNQSSCCFTSISLIRTGRYGSLQSLVYSPQQSLNNKQMSVHVKLSMNWGATVRVLIVTPGKLSADSNLPRGMLPQNTKSKHMNNFLHLTILDENMTLQFMVTAFLQL